MTLPPDDHGSDDLRNTIGDVDPLKWLESLAARQGANPEEFVTSADLEVPEVPPDASVDEPGYRDYDPYGGEEQPAAAQPPAEESAEEPAEKPAEEVSAARQPQPIAPEVDPLAWLESLARRQGANPEEFVTSADVEIEEVPADAVVDEPGYTPYEASAKPAAVALPPEPVAAPAPAAEIETEAVAPPEPEQFTEPELAPGVEELDLEQAAELLGMPAEDLIPPRAEPVAEEAELAVPAVESQPAPEASAAPLGEDVDPLAWLESLARRQGARSEELITGGTLEVPEVTGDVMPDEPGYEDYSPFGTLAEEAAEELLAEQGETPEPVAEEVPSGNETLAWLEGLAAEQEVVPAESPSGDDPLAGLSDEEIELRAAAGELTIEQMEAWLKRQAASLAEVHLKDEDEFLEELPPAEPAEIPDWLQEAAPVMTLEPEKEAAPEPAAEAEQAAPAEIPDWLRDAAPLVEGSTPEELAAILEQAAEEAGVEELSPEEYDDAWAMALDSEFLTTQKMAKEEEPEWYQAAINDPERQAELEAELTTRELETHEEAADEALEPLAEAELPGWLSEAASEADDEEIPEWLVEDIPGSELVETVTKDWLLDEELDEDAELPAWLAEQVEQAEIPDWLKDAAPDHMLAEEEEAPVPEPVTPAVAEVVPAAEPAPVVVPPVAEVSAEIPAGAAYDSFRTRLAQQPDDHATRLALARRLVEDDNVASSLGQYEVLVLAQAHLGELERDLKVLVERYPALPQARRVLGDVFMRQGRLKDALAAYRTALEQL
ncbi:MAG: hypothetical protein Kow0077_32560 [Anaerolineae bacterium]